MTDTKQITFEGREYTVPVWVEWVARDKSGAIYGFEEKPIDGMYAFRAKSIPWMKRYTFIAECSESWRDSLTKV